VRAQFEYLKVISAKQYYIIFLYFIFSIGFCTPPGFEEVIWDLLLSAY
jgi:hypothetical protein